MGKTKSNSANKLHKLLKACVSSGVMAWAMMAGGTALAGTDPCTVNGTTVICEGDQTGGVYYSSGVDQLIVRNLSTDIVASAGYGAGLYSNTGPVTLDVDTTGYVINTSGYKNHALYAVSHANGFVVNSVGALTTSGQQGYGIFASGQAGTGILNNSASISTSGQEAKAIYAQMLSGDLTVTNWGDINTTGQSAFGIQGISQLGNVELASSGFVRTWGDYAHGIVFGSANGNTLINVSGDVETNGQEASGIYMFDYYGQLGLTLSAGVTTTGAGSYGVRSESQDSQHSVLVTSTGTITTSGNNAQAIRIRDFGTASAGASVVQVDGELITYGDNAAAIFGEYASQGANTIVNGRVSTLGSSSEGVIVSAANGATNFTLTGSVVTGGSQSDAAVFTSAGAHSSTFDIQSDGLLHAAGYSAAALKITTDGATTITNAGRVLTEGSYANVIAVTDIGSGNAHQIINTGQLQAYGSHSSAIKVITDGAVTIDNSGTVLGGGGTGWAIDASAGNGVTLTNNGTISAGSGQALLFGAGDDTISNFGRIEGEVDMGGGLNAFTNEDGGELVLWDDFILNGATPVGSSDTKIAVAGELSNNGLLYVYGDGLIGTSTITGDLFQSTLGTLVFDADAASFTTDYLVVTGNADLSGTIRLNLQNVPVNLADAPDFPTDLFSYSIIRAGSLSMADGLIFDPAELTIENTVAYTFALRAENGAIIVDVIEMTSNFEDMLDTLATDYQTGFALYLDRQQQAPDTTGIQTLVDALRNLPDATALQASFNTFAPYSVIAQDRLLRDDARSLLSRAPGCNPGAGVEFCLTGGVDYGEASGDFTAFSDEYEADRTGLSFGIGLNVAENWQAGAEVRVSADDLRLPGDATADQDSYVLAGGVTGTVFNGLQLGVSGLIGNASADVSRGSLLSTAQRLTSDQETRVQGVSARVAYPVAAGDWTITPGLQASNVCIDGDAFSEAGGLADAISVDAHDSCLSAFGPQLSVQTPAFELGGFQATGFAQLGYEALNDEDIVVSAALNGAGLPDDRFQTRFAGDGDARTSVMFGLQGQNEAGWTIRAGAGLSETDTQSIWSAGLSFARAL